MGESASESNGKVSVKKTVYTAADIRHQSSWLGRHYARLRHLEASLRSYATTDDLGGSWLRSVFYHSVFPDEVTSFREQVKCFKNIADLISLDEAVEIANSASLLAGRYICVTFDDGLRCTYQNAMPLLVAERVPAAFFVITKYVSETIERQPYIVPGCRYYAEYLSWQECREMTEAGMIIGSHTTSHRRLSDLDEDTVKYELVNSKQDVEQRLNHECKYFACPWGRAGVDWIIGRDVGIARQAGYEAFLCGEPGPTPVGAGSFPLPRNYVSASWSARRALRAAARRGQARQTA